MRVAVYGLLSAVV